MKTALVFLLSLTTFIVSGQTTRLKLASDSWPPFTDVDSAHALALDLVKEALAREKLQAHTDIVGFNQVIEGIRSGKYDGSAALWRSPEREAFLLYSDPYLENRLVLVGKKGSNVSATSFAELKGKRIAVVGSYGYGIPPDDAKNMVLVSGTSDQQNLENVLHGKADYMLVDALLIEYLIEYQSKEAAEHLEIGKNTLLTRSLHFAIRKDIPGADSIIRKFNVEIKQMIAEGVYNRILNLNWIDIDVDGDGRTELVLVGEQAGTQAPLNSYVVKSNSGKSNSTAQGYYIQGVHYDDWEHVPEKYKVRQSNAAPNSGKSGFGPVFSF